MKYFTFLLVLFISGCASAQDYTLYVNSQVQIETARHAADAEKYKALAAIAQSGSDTAKVAAVMALTNTLAGPAIGQLRPPSNEALQWAALLLPSLTNIASVVYGARVGINSSNNAASVAMSTNESFLGIAGKIQAPAVPQANTYTFTRTQDSHDMSTTSLTGTGVLGSGSYATTNITANRTRTTSDSFNPVATTTDNSVVNPAPTAGVQP